MNMLGGLGLKLENIGYRLSLLKEISRLRHAGRHITNILSKVIKSPSRYDDFIQNAVFYR